MTNKINYDFFLKLDKWTKKDAALILSGHDPSDYKNLRLTQNDLPQALIASQQLYRIFCSVNFREKYGRENYPLDYFLECHRKGIVLSERLLMRLTWQVSAIELPDKKMIEQVHQWYDDKLWLFKLVGKHIGHLGT